MRGARQFPAVTYPVRGVGSPHALTHLHLRHSINILPESGVVGRHAYLLS